MNTLRILSALIVLALVQSICGGNSTPTAPPEPTKNTTIGIITGVQTLVEVGTSNSLSQLTGARNLQNNEYIKVTNSGVAQLDFKNQISIKLFNNTTVGGVSAEVLDPTPSRFRLKLERGGLSGQVVPNGGYFGVEIANGASITILGTQFFITFDPETGFATVGNFEGTVGYTLPGGETAFLEPGTQMDIAPDGTPAFFELPFDLITFDNQARGDNSPLLGLNNLRREYGIPLVNEPQPTEPPSMTEAPPKSVNLTVWSPYEAPYQEIFLNSIKTYQDIHPEVNVEFTYLPSSGFLENLIASTQAGEGPDIILWDHYNIGRLAESGVITALNSFGVSANELATFEPAPKQAVIWQGSIWAFPLAEEGIALLTNRTLFQTQYYPTSQWDFDSLIKNASIYFDVEHKGDSPPVYLFCNPGLGLQGSAPAYFAAPFLLGSGYPQNLKIPGYMDENGDLYLTTETVVEGGYIIASMRSIPPDANYQVCQSLFLEWRTAAFWTGPWEITSLGEAGMNLNELGVLPMGRPFIVAKSAMLTNLALRRDNIGPALELIRYLSGPEAGFEYGRTGQIIPANSEALKRLGKGLIFDFGIALQAGVAQPNVPFEDRQWGPVDDAIRNIWDGWDPYEALKEAELTISIPPNSQ